MLIQLDAQGVYGLRHAPQDDQTGHGGPGLRGGSGREVAGRRCEG